MKVLAFSGGKDSWACLLLNRRDLANITVVWVNTGKNYPELLHSIAEARKICQHFVEIKVDRDSQNAQCGLPSDVVPVNSTVIGKAVTGTHGATIQAYLDCCNQNISMPFTAWCVEHGVSEVIRGQRACESHKSTITNGMEANGITYIHPIESWTDAQVRDYLCQVFESSLPEHFMLNHSSMDCYDCSAYRKETRDLHDYTRRNHPLLYVERTKRMLLVDDAINAALYTNN